MAWYFIARGPFGPGWMAAGGSRGPGRRGADAVVLGADRHRGALGGVRSAWRCSSSSWSPPAAGATLLGLFVFLAWILPPVFGSILGAAKVGDQLAMAVVSISPIAGIAMATDLGPSSETGTDLLKLAALIPALVFALLFNNGVTWARRRAVAEIHGGPAAIKPEAEPDPLAA